MKRYSHDSRLASIAALAAVLATGATIGLAVVLPAKLAPTEAPAMAAQHGPTEVAILPSIEVIGYRTEHTVVDTPKVREARAAEASKS
ncbi:MAG TPA: hypothetical protein VFC24_12165 [Casimicrobiaceae bacterium]|nr:hypothetical protein [Casimicrobiaceae bacterium]